MPKSTTQGEVKVKTNIQPGLASSAQKVAWHKFWQKLISEDKQRNDRLDR